MRCSALADPGFGRGGGLRNFVRDFADVAKWSRASEASQYWPGSRARLRALEALAFLTLKYAFSHFSWYFFFKLFNIHCVWMNYKISISISKILNILENAIFLFFISDNQGSCFFIYFCLLKHYSVSQGSRACLGPQKLSLF